jgi:hypothetical protein
MLSKLRRTAAERGIDVTVHHAPIEEMDLGRTYRSIFLAGPTFNLIADDATAGRALERIRAHLDPAGAALIPLFVPEPVPERHLGVVREHIDEGGRTLRVTATATERDDEVRRQVTTLRYEVVDRDVVEVVERPWVLHWHTQSGFRDLAEQAGLRVEAILGSDGSHASPDVNEYGFVLRRADAPVG